MSSRVPSSPCSPRSIKTSDESASSTSMSAMNTKDAQQQWMQDRDVFGRTRQELGLLQKTIVVDYLRQASVARTASYWLTMNPTEGPAIYDAPATLDINGEMFALRDWGGNTQTTSLPAEDVVTHGGEHSEGLGPIVFRVRFCDAAGPLHQALTHTFAQIGQVDVENGKPEYQGDFTLAVEVQADNEASPQHAQFWLLSLRRCYDLEDEKTMPPPAIGNNDHGSAPSSPEQITWLYEGDPDLKPELQFAVAKLGPLHYEHGTLVPFSTTIDHSTKDRFEVFKYV